MYRAPEWDVTGILAYERELHGFVERHVSHPEDAADVCQDVLTRAHVMFPHFKRRSHPRTWLLSIAHHAVVDYYRRENVRHSFIRTEHVSRWQGGVSGSNVRSVLEAREQIEHCVRCVMCNLLVKQQVAVLLCEFQGYSDKTAARALRKPFRTFKRILHDARATLHESCGAECMLVAKAGLQDGCPPQLRRNPAPPRPRDASSESYLLKLRDRHVREILFFDPGRADCLIATGANRQ